MNNNDKDIDIDFDPDFLNWAAHDLEDTILFYERQIQTMQEKIAKYRADLSRAKTMLADINKRQSKNDSPKNV